MTFTSTGLRLAAVSVLGLLCAIVSPAAHSQRYVFTTLAGGLDGDAGAATEAIVSSPIGLALDATGNLYISEHSRHRIRKMSPDGSIRTIAGTGIPGYAIRGPHGSVGRITTGQINAPRSIVLDQSGNLYFSDTGNNRVRKLTPDGRIVLVAGNGSTTSSGDGGRGVDAGIARPYGLAFDGSGNLYIAESLGHRIRKVRPDGLISTFAGNGVRGFGGDGGPAGDMNLNVPAGIAFDSSGALYIADTLNQRVRKVSMDGIASTVAGNGNMNSNGDGGAATSAAISFPYSVALDAADNLYIGDSLCAIRRVDADGVINRVAGQYHSCAFSGEGSAAVSATISIPEAMVFAPNGDLFFADSDNHRVRRIASGNIHTVAGVGSFTGDGGPAADATFSSTTGISLGNAGELYVTDYYANHRIRRISADGVVSTVAGNGGNARPCTGAYTTAVATATGFPSDTAVDAAGNLYIAEIGSDCVSMVTSGGLLTSIAGTGLSGYSGDGGSATSAKLRLPRSVVVDASGTIYVADSGNHLVRKISGGIITTIAGNGSPEFKGDGGLATSASLNTPSSLALDASGNLFIADMDNSRIRKVTPDGMISTVAGDGTDAFGGDGGMAVNAAIGRPTGIAVSDSGDLYIAGGALRKVGPLGFISTLSDLRHPAYDVAAGNDGVVYVVTLSGRVFKGTPDFSPITLPKKPL